MTMQTALNELEQLLINNVKTTDTEPVPLTLRETEEPPPLPNFTYSTSLAPNIQVTLEGAETSAETSSLATVEAELWPRDIENQKVLLVNVPNSSVESIAFGLYDVVGSTNPLFKVAFVARMSNDDRGTFLAAVEGITVEEPLTSELPEILQDQLKEWYSSSARLVIEGPSNNDEGFSPQVAA